MARIALGACVGAAAGGRCPGCRQPVKAAFAGWGCSVDSGCLSEPWLVTSAGCWQGQLLHDLGGVGSGGLVAVQPGVAGQCQPSLTRRSLSSALRRWPQCCCSSQLRGNRALRMQRQGLQLHLLAPAGLPEQRWEGWTPGHGCVRARGPALCYGAAGELQRLQGWESSLVQLLSWQQGLQCRACLGWTRAPSQDSERATCHLSARSQSSGKQQRCVSRRSAASQTAGRLCRRLEMCNRLAAVCTWALVTSGERECFTDALGLSLCRSAVRPLSGTLLAPLMMCACNDNLDRLPSKCNMDKPGRCWKAVWAVQDDACCLQDNVSA